MYRLYKWYLSTCEYGLIAHGNVTGHPRFPDSMLIHTSPIQNITINGDEIHIETLNSLYVCEVKEFGKTILDIQELMDEDYKTLLEPVLAKIIATDFTEPAIKANNEVILFIGNTREYYFDKMVLDINGEYEIKKEMYPHIGTFQDSVICDYWVGDNCVDLRYFPYQGNKLQFYCVDKPDNIKLSIENMGNAIMTVGINGKVYKIQPGSRQEILLRSPNEKSEDIDGTDLYSADMM